MINYDLTKIKAIIFDIDGVLSRATVSMSSEGLPVRTLNIKDGYAIQLAVKMGIRIAIMTGGGSEEIRKRYVYLGVEDIYMHCAMKIKTYQDFLQTYSLTDEQILYMGDDIPDYEVMQKVGCPCCPSDACAEVKGLSLYISQIRGGYGCARDVIEQVLRAQNKWLNNSESFGW